MTGFNDPQPDYSTTTATKPQHSSSQFGASSTVNSTSTSSSSRLISRTTHQSTTSVPSPPPLNTSHWAIGLQARPTTPSPLGRGNHRHERRNTTVDGTFSSLGDIERFGRPLSTSRRTRSPSAAREATAVSGNTPQTRFSQPSSSSSSFQQLQAQQRQRPRSRDSSASSSPVVVDQHVPYGQSSSSTALTPHQNNNNNMSNYTSFEQHHRHPAPPTPRRSETSPSAQYRHQPQQGKLARSLSTSGVHHRQPQPYSRALGRTFVTDWTNGDSPEVCPVLPPSRLPLRLPLISPHTP